MEALLVSPLRPWQIIVGKVAPYLAIGFISVVGVILEARLVFHVPLRGSVVLLLGERAAVHPGVAVARHPRVGAHVVAARRDDGGAWSARCCRRCCCPASSSRSRACRASLQLVSNIVPARWFVFVARSIMLKGVGLDYLWRETLVLVADGRSCC